MSIRPHYEGQVPDTSHQQLLSRKEMILELDEIPPLYFLAVGFCSWLLLAGFLISPSTYASIKESGTLSEAGDVGKSLMSAVRNVPLLYIASFTCLLAAIGLGVLWWRWKHNYIWVRRYVIVPTLMNSAMGLVSTFLNVYSIQNGEWSITAIITASIIGAWFAVAGGLYLWYSQVLLPKQT